MDYQIFAKQRDIWEIHGTLTTNLVLKISNKRDFYKLLQIVENKYKICKFCDMYFIRMFIIFKAEHTDVTSRIRLIAIHGGQEFYWNSRGGPTRQDDFLFAYKHLLIGYQIKRRFRV